jgi:hypothetical protein
MQRGTLDGVAANPGVISVSKRARVPRLAGHPSANNSSINNNLYGVARSSGNRLWAVGGYESEIYAASLTLTERWNGKYWNIIPSPNDGLGNNDLYGVAAISDTDVWAVGQRVARSTSQSKTLIEHRNGSKWSIVESPSPGASYNGLESLAIVSSKNIWATGSSSSGYTSQTLVEQWNGSQWMVVSSPNVPGSVYNSLGGLVSVNAHDLWAVGDSESAPAYAARTLIER